MRVVLDTNVLVAAFTARGACAELVEHVLEHHELCLDRNLLGECERVLASKFRAAPERVAEVAEFLTRRRLHADPRPLPTAVCRDPDDDRVLALCAAVEAAVLVTGDADLLVLGDFAGTRIVRPAEYWVLVSARK